MNSARLVSIIDVCSEIFAGGDAPKENYSLTPTEEYQYPIYSNGESNNGLYGYTNTARVNQPSITISARGTIGFAAIREAPFTPVVRLITLIPNQEIVNIKYLYYAVQGFSVSQTGTSIPQLTVPMIKQYSFPLPDLDTQQKVVHILDKTCFLIEHYKSYYKKMDELIKSRFVEMFGDPVTNPKTWSIIPLKHLTTKIGSGATPKGGKESYCDYGISLIRSMNVHNGRFEYKDLAHINIDQAEALKNVIVEKNDILLNITGASVARSCIVPDNVIPARVNQHVCIIRCDDSVIPVFLNAILISESYQHLLWEIAGSGATREAITKQQIEMLSIICPPIELQNQFAEFVAKVEQQKTTVQKSIDRLETLKKSLMQEYFG